MLVAFKSEKAFSCHLSLRKIYRIKIKCSTNTANNINMHAEKPEYYL